MCGLSNKGLSLTPPQEKVLSVCRKSSVDINRERGPTDRALQVRWIVKGSELFIRAILRAEITLDGYFSTSLYSLKRGSWRLWIVTTLLTHVGLPGAQTMTPSLPLCVTFFILALLFCPEIWEIIFLQNAGKPLYKTAQYHFQEDIFLIVTHCNENLVSCILNI
jgi:hypothetical protein